MTSQINMFILLKKVREHAEDIDVRLNISKALNIPVDIRTLDLARPHCDMFFRTKTEDNGFYLRLRSEASPIYQTMLVQRYVRWYGYKDNTIRFSRWITDEFGYRPTYPPLYRTSYILEVEWNVTKMLLTLLLSRILSDFTIIVRQQ
jgi:hypothetical protein